MFTPSKPKPRLGEVSFISNASNSHCIEVFQTKRKLYSVSSRLPAICLRAIRAFHLHPRRTICKVCGCSSARTNVSTILFDWCSQTTMLANMKNWVCASETWWLRLERGITKCTQRSCVSTRRSTKKPPLSCTERIGSHGVFMGTSFDPCGAGRRQKRSNVLVTTAASSPKCALSSAPWATTTILLRQTPSIGPPRMLNTHARSSHWMTLRSWRWTFTTVWLISTAARGARDTMGSAAWSL